MESTTVFAVVTVIYLIGLFILFYRIRTLEETLSDLMQENCRLTSSLQEKAPEKKLAAKEAPAEKPLRGDLIKLVSSGKAYINYGKGKHGTLEQLRQVLIECFPKDAWEANGDSSCYEISKDEERWWDAHPSGFSNLQEIKLSEFFQQASGSAPSEAFQEGQKAWNLFDNEGKQVKNPYPKFKEDYAEWRRGFNVGISDVNVD